MKFKFVILVICLGLTVMVSGCCSSAKKQKDDGRGILGAWKLKDTYLGNTVLNFRKGGDYEIDFDGDSTREIWGHYELDWDKIKLNDKGGQLSQECKGTGMYSYTLAGGELRFNFESDGCSSRAKYFGYLWVRK